MYIQVRLLNGFKKNLTYSVSDEFKKDIHLGTIISVPLKHTTQLAVVEKVDHVRPRASFEIREIIGLEKFPQDPHYFNFLKKLSYYYVVPSFLFLSKIRSFVSLESKSDEIVETNSDEVFLKNDLSEEQKKISDTIFKNVSDSKFYPALIYGVTGSGKSEIYKDLIEKTVLSGKSVIMILPEVSLAIEFEKKFKKYFGTLFEIFSFHSGTSAKDKKNLWSAINSKKALFVIGVRLPVLLPMNNLGLIIVDEEHDTSYQDQKYPRINSKEAALIRAQEYGIPIVLGSATPSLTSFYNVFRERWHLFELKNRFSGSLCSVRAVDLTKSKRNRPNFWISSELQDAIKDRLLKKEQIIIYLNRRGFSFFVQCADCGYVFECKNCSVSLTYHNDETLRCHYCDFKILNPEACNDCSSSKFVKKGIGTQQLVEILKTLFPECSIERADLDVSSKKNKLQKIISDFESGEIDILVGTQTITKGYNFPNVTLVGIIWADLDLSLPSYNAYETTVQKIIQVAGRAGRFKKPGEVIVQILNKNENFKKYIQESKYLDFVKLELETRKQFKYPPYTRFFEIEIKCKDALILEKDTEKISNLLSLACNNSEILGPVDPPVNKVKNVYRKAFFIKAVDHGGLHAFKLKLEDLKIQSEVFITPNPIY